MKTYLKPPTSPRFTNPKLHSSQAIRGAPYNGVSNEGAAAADGAAATDGVLGEVVGFVFVGLEPKMTLVLIGPETLVVGWNKENEDSHLVVWISCL